MQLLVKYGTCESLTVGGIISFSAPKGCSSVVTYTQSLATIQKDGATELHDAFIRHLVTCTNRSY